MFSRYISIYSGKIELDSQQGDELRKNIAYVSGEGIAFGNQNIYDVANFMQEFHPNFNMKQYCELVKYFDLPYLPIKNMSKGQRTKAELALNWCKGVDYLLLDEPFTGKDIFTRKEFVQLMASQMTEKQSIIIATHLINDIENFIDRALIMKEGRLVCDIDSDAVREEYGTLENLLEQHTNYKKDQIKNISLE